MQSYGAILKVPTLRRLMTASVAADLAGWLGVGAPFIIGGAGLMLVGIIALAFGLKSQRFGDGRGA